MRRRESGNYPPGAEFDPRAPWNENEAPRTRWSMAWKNTCIECDQYRPCDENGFCKKCFEPKEIEKEHDRDDAD